MPRQVLLSGLPIHLVAAARDSAVLDADAVASFLDRIEGVGRKSPSDPPIKFSATFLLGLGAALRLAFWEHRGLFPHLAAGLPRAEEAILEMMHWCSSEPPAQRDRLVHSFCMKVTEISATRFAWEGPALLGAAVLIGEPDEDALLDALAEFVWHHRHEGAS